MIALPTRSKLNLVYVPIPDGPLPPEILNFWAHREFPFLAKSEFFIRALAVLLSSYDDPVIVPPQSGQVPFYHFVSNSSLDRCKFSANGRLLFPDDLNSPGLNENNLDSSYHSPANTFDEPTYMYMDFLEYLMR